MQVKNTAFSAYFLASISFAYCLRMRQLPNDFNYG